jgi:glycosyltransferase involved in cell wall biosynthesis
MPVRNAAATLAKAIDSIRCQTFTDWELIAADDGSDDDTPHVLERYSAKDPRIRVLKAGGRGIVAALNTGLSAAKAGLVARMDADDLCRNDRLERQVDHLNAHASTGLVGCLVEFGGDRKQSEGYALHVDWLNSIRTPREIRRNRFVESPFAHPSVMFRRSLIDRHGGYAEGSFPEDYELWLRWLDAGVRMEKLSASLLTWTDAVNRLSRTDARYAPEAFYGIKARYLAQELRRRQGHRQLWIWGAGRPTRKRAELLCQHGLTISGFIDVDPAKIGTALGERQVVSAQTLPSPRTTVVVSFVGNRGARELIRGQLSQAGFREGQDFWMAA